MNEQQDEIDIMYPNIKLSREILNWSPKVTLDNGLKKTVKFYREKY